MLGRLSRPATDIGDSYEVVVVGSGYGGGVAAARLARAGRSVCVLERGREIHPGEYPDTPREGLRELQLVVAPGQRHGSATAMYDFRLGPDLNVLVGCGLGGTSLINAGVGLEPDLRVFDDAWPTALRGGRDEELIQGFQRAREVLQPRVLPGGTDPEKLRALRRSADTMGVGDRVRRVPVYVSFEDRTNPFGVDQRACQHCGDCVSGCNYGAKNTVLMNYLPDAWAHGAHIFTEARVHHVEAHEGRWRVMYEPVEWQADLFDVPLSEVSADVVILAAGTLGSTEILLRSAARGLSVSSRLGERFSGNGDFLAFGFGADVPVHSMGVGSTDRHRERPLPGPCISGIIDLRDEPDPDDGLLVQEGVAPAVLADIPRLIARLAPDDTRPSADALSRTQIYLTMGHDGADGTLALTGDEDEAEIAVRWPDVGRKPTFEHANDLLHRAADAIGASYVPNPSWYLSHDLITVQPLGGCAMGDDAQHGVVDDRGRVFDGAEGVDVHDGLYVADGAVVPRSLGTNPSLTITALAERTVALLARDRGWTIDATRRERPPAVIGERSPLGIEWSERMTGWCSTDLHDDFVRAERLGRAKQSELELELTIIADDLERMLADPRRECRVRGWVRVPALAHDAMPVTHGVFRLHVPDPSRVETQQMHYRLQIHGPDHRTFLVRGHKEIHDDPGSDVWSDTTTLFVTIFDRADAAAPVATGIARMTVSDFARELASTRVRNAPDASARVRALTRFGRMFFGELFHTYGKILVEPPDFRAGPRPLARRELRAPERETHTCRTNDHVALRLTRFPGGSKGPVLVSHAFGTSTLAFRIPTIDTNLVEHLVAHGYDVWLFDYRASPLVDPPRRRFTLDDVALRDWPAAVAHVREVTGAPDVQAVAHCVGSMTLLMALLGGLRGVRAVVSSALTTHPSPNELNRIKVRLGLTTALPLFGIRDLDPRVHDRLEDHVFDRLLHLYPMPRHERCGSPICRRIFAIYGPSYKHSQLNAATHDAIAAMFGVERVSSFLHLNRILAAGQVVDAGGKDTYLPNLERLALPIRFLHGTDNREFLPETSVTAFDLLRTTFDERLYTYVPIEGYGHMDVVIGKDAARDVYPRIVEHLDAW